MSGAPRETLEVALDLLAPLRDVVLGRVVGPEVPAWCARRGWAPWLLARSDAELEALEATGLGRAEPRLLEDAPESLRALVRAVATLLAPYWAPRDAAPGAPSTDASPRLDAARGASPRPDAPAATSRLDTARHASSGAAPRRDASPDDRPPLEPPARPGRRVKARKRLQVEALREAAAPLAAGARRVIDVGAGHGHLTRALRERLALPALGLERDPARVRVARELAGPAGPRFEATDASRAIPAGPGDLLVGLHACGGLGDALVTRAAATGAHALLVSCCHQKIDGPARAPLSRLARDRGFELPREALGLANLAYGLEIVSGGAEAIQRGRETRHALALLLRERGVDLGPGDEARSIGRDRFRKGLAHVAPRALARRGLAPPGPTELETTLARAREEHGRMRRLGLPRGLLGRLLELALVLDRAVALEEAGHAVRVEPAFPAQVSPRNLALLARARS